MGTASNDQITVFDVIEGEILKTVKCHLFAIFKIKENSQGHFIEKYPGQIFQRAILEIIGKRV